MQSQSTFREQQEFNLRQHKGAAFFTGLGRVLLIVAFAALAGAWITQLTGKPLLGMSQLHLFLDAVVLGILGIGCLVDALLHARGY